MKSDIDVLVDLTPLDTWSRGTGTGYYVSDLAAALDALDERERRSLALGALVDLDGDACVGPLSYRGAPEPRWKPDDEKRWLTLRRTRLVATLRRLRPRLFHATYHMGTPRGSLVPRVVTCLDLVRLVLHAEYLPGRPVYRRILRAAEALRFHTARRVIAISEHTARDLVRLLGVSPKRIDVVYEGVDHERFRPARSDAEREARKRVIEKHGLAPRGYVVHLGLADPRKSVDTLVHAFARAKLDGLVLAFAGRLRGANEERVRRAIADAGNPPGIRLLGFVPDEDLPALLEGAFALPYTSIYEGFGNAPVEAMACGCPVIANGATSVAETVGDAAVLVPPRDPDALAAALRRLAAEPALRADLARAGVARAARFTWREAALGTIETYWKALREG